MVMGVVAVRGLLLRDGTLEESLEVNARLQTVADAIASKNSTEYQFLRHLRLCASCANFERIGGKGNGGYVMCADHLDAPKLEGAYSFGIDGSDAWGMEVASKYHIPLYEYDCFNWKVPKPCDGCNVKFFTECIKGEYERFPLIGRTYRTLTEHMRRNGQANVSNASLLLKLDVENSEWSLLSNLPVETLRKFRHLNMELHNIKTWIHTSVGLNSLQKLVDAGFSVVHLHGNNWGRMVQVQEVRDGEHEKYQIPDFLEVTMVRQDPGTPCANVPPKRIPQDQKVLPARAELPDPILPKM
jgi:hypothetical protein